MLSRKLSRKMPVAGVLLAVLVMVPGMMPVVVLAGAGTRVAVSDPVSAPVAAASVQVAPRFKAGDTLTLRIGKSKYVDIKGMRSSQQSSSGDITIRVLSNDATGTRLECVYGAIAVLDDTASEIRNNPLMQVMVASREGMKVRFATGPRFANPVVENVDEVLAAYRQTLNKAAEVMQPEIRTAVMRLIEPMLANKQAFAAKLVEELYVYFTVIGTDVPLQGALASRSSTQSPAGGAPVKTWSTIRVERYDRTAGRVQLRYEQTSNPQDVQALAERMTDAARKEAIAHLGVEATPAESSKPSATETPAKSQPSTAQQSQTPPLNAPQSTAAASAAQPQAVQPPAASSATEISVQDVAVYDVDLGTGWSDSVNRVRTLKLGDQLLVDQTTMTRMK